MPTLTYPYTFTNGLTADANQVDANFNAAQTVINGLDNANVGAAGFYAQQLIPTNAVQATFGGTQQYTFPAGLCVANSPTTGQLLIGGGTSAATIDWNITGAGYLSVNKPTRFTALGSNGVQFIPTSDATAATLIVTNAAASAAIFRVDNLTANTGIAAISRGSALGQLLPVLTNAGGQVPNTMHSVMGTVTAAGASTAVTLSNNPGAQFSSATSYVPIVIDTTAAVGTLAPCTTISATGFTFTSTNGHTYAYFCVGV